MALTEEDKRRIEQEELSKNLSPITQPSSKNKNSGAAVASFLIPGLGQILKGQIGRGLLIFISCVIGLGLGVVPGIIIYIWQIYDANNK